MRPLNHIDIRLGTESALELIDFDVDDDVILQTNGELCDRSSHFKFNLNEKNYILWELLATSDLFSKEYKKEISLISAETNWNQI